jgi:hypothetical protein
VAQLARLPPNDQQKVIQNGNNIAKLAIMTASARVDLQVTTRRRHEFQCLLDLARKITARPIIAATTVKLVFLRL